MASKGIIKTNIQQVILFLFCQISALSFLSDYLCSPDANVYEIEFLRFKIRDIDSDTVLFEIAKPTNTSINPSTSTSSNGAETSDYKQSRNHTLNNNNPKDPNTGRFVRYQFTPKFLNLKNIGATITFSIGDFEINNFRMIEKHYYSDNVHLKTFDFNFGYCIPNSVNTCEHIYVFPNLSKSLTQDMIDNPFRTKSDSFYFINNKLFMHNKAEYSYNGV